MERVTPDEIEEEIEKFRTANNGFRQVDLILRFQLPNKWPPPKGWRQLLIKHRTLSWPEAMNLETDESAMKRETGTRKTNPGWTALRLLNARLVLRDKPLFCRHCDPELLAEYRHGASAKRVVQMLGRRNGVKVVLRKWPDGRRDWMCHRCGRQVGKIDGEKSDGNAKQGV